MPRPCHRGVAEPQQEDEVNDDKVEGTICKKLLTGKKDDGDAGGDDTA